MLKSKANILIIDIILILFVLIVFTNIMGYINNSNSASNSILVKDSRQNAIEKLNQLSQTGNTSNGIYLFEHDKHLKYLLLSDYIVKQNEKASYFTSVNAKMDKETLIINFKESSTDNYRGKIINNILLYKINEPKNIYKIDIYKNGKRTYFESIICN
jgi:hypothetical protein